MLPIKLPIKEIAAVTLATVAFATTISAHTENSWQARNRASSGRGWTNQATTEQIQRASRNLRNFTTDQIEQWADVVRDEASAKAYIAKLGNPNGAKSGSWAYDNSLKNTIVKHGVYLGKDLYWIAKWAVESFDEPAKMATNGGSSGWKLLNTADPLVDAPFKSAKDISPSSSAQVLLPTWADGATGAYAIISDDIGAFESTEGYAEIVDIAETYNAQERGFFGEYNPIRVGFGVQVDKSDETEYQWMRDAVEKGHEMLNHSYDHSSAAEQWLWFYQDDASGKTKEEIHGFTLNYGDTLPMSGVLEGREDPYVAHLAYINKVRPNGDTVVMHVGKDMPKWASGAICLSKGAFAAKSGTVTEYFDYNLKN